MLPVQGPLFHLFVPKQAAGANLIYFDFFNATGSATEVQLISVVPVSSGAVAVTGIVGTDLHLQRTTAIGTAGTAATREGSDIAAATFSRLAGSHLLHGSITARLTPTGGATGGALMSWGCVFSEETNAGTYTPARDLVTYPILIPENQGFRVIQGAVAATGNIGFNCIFATRLK